MACRQLTAIPAAIPDSGGYIAIRSNAESPTQLDPVKSIVRKQARQEKWPEGVGHVACIARSFTVKHKIEPTFSHCTATTCVGHTAASRHE